MATGNSVDKSTQALTQPARPVAPVSEALLNDKVRDLDELGSGRSCSEHLLMRFD